MLKKGDFHIHSTASDGGLTPREIVIAAKERGLDIIAIADHNTTAGVLEGIVAGREFGVTVIPAIELSTRYKRERIHILGYFTDDSYNNSTFKTALKLIKAHKTMKARSMISEFITTETSGDYLTIIEGIDLLRAFGAAVVLAHPVRINKNHIEEILKLPFDGIEARYCRNSNEDTAYFINIALERFSFYTGGSDFHGSKRNDLKHSFIGETFLTSTEIEIFLNKSRIAEGDLI
jgi:predicted metal-dependent phosphoesterase TrpH